MSTTWLRELSQLYTVLRRIYYKRKLKFDREGARKAQDLQHSISALNPSAFRQYQLALEVFVDLARDIGAQPILMTQARLPAASNTPAQKERIDYHHVGLSHEALVETFDRLDALVREVAAQKGAGLVDASADMAGKDWAFYDHAHLTPDGSESLAQLTADALQSGLKLVYASGNRHNGGQTHSPIRGP